MQNFENYLCGEEKDGLKNSFFLSFVMIGVLTAEDPGAS